MKKTILTLTALLATALSFNAAAQASFPNKPIKLVIGFPAGGPLDNHARLMTDRLGQLLGQPIVIEYKAGAGGGVGAEFVAKSPADGYTILLANTGTMVINPALYPKLGYDMNKDFAPLARTAQQALALLVNPNVKANTLPEFLALLKANPGKINYGSAGSGGISHLVPEMMKQATNTYMVHIPYRGSAPAFTDLLAGHVQFMAESIPLATQYVKQGKVRALAVTSKARNNALPDVPTAEQAGLKNFEVVGFYGFLAPAGTPKEIVSKLSNAFKAALDTPDIRSKMIDQGADPAYLSADQFDAFLKAELPRWAKVVKLSGAKLD